MPYLSPKTTYVLVKLLDYSIRSTTASYSLEERNRTGVLLVNTTTATPTVG